MFSTSFSFNAFFNLVFIIIVFVYANIVIISLTTLKIKKTLILIINERLHRYLPLHNQSQLQSKVLKFYSLCSYFLEVFFYFFLYLLLYFVLTLHHENQLVVLSLLPYKSSTIV